MHITRPSSIIREWSIHSGQCLRDVYGHEAYIYGYVMCQMNKVYIVPCMHDTVYTAFHCFLEEGRETLCPVEKTVLSECGKVGGGGEMTSVHTCIPFKFLSCLEVLEC